jgi:hypothetical protein
MPTLWLPLLTIRGPKMSDNSVETLTKTADTLSLAASKSPDLFITLAALGVAMFALFVVYRISMKK